MNQYVWYAAYGSNLSRERFECYLRGGTPSGANHAYPGCRDASYPRDDRAHELKAELAFGGTSQTWGGGVAFVTANGDDRVKARLYLITLDQFADVVAQENWLECGSVEIAEPFDTRLTDCVYGVVLPVGLFEDRPVLTVTQPDATSEAPPTPDYLRHIATGLRDAHEMSDDEIVAYLATKRGIADAMTREQLSAALSSLS